jgi:hypothetical protein
MSGPRAASLSPDGNYGAALSLRPSAHYLMDDVLVRRVDEWKMCVGEWGGLSWSKIGQEDRGVCALEMRPPRLRR